MSISVSPYNPVQQAGCRAKNPPDLVIASRAPALTDFGYFLGTLWLAQGVGYYGLVQVIISPTVKQGIWVALNTESDLNTLSGDTGSATPLAGNIQLRGTSAQIHTVASGSTVTFSLIGPYTPATYTSHGVLIGEGAASIQATAAGITGQLFQGNTGANPSWTSSPSVTGNMTVGADFIAGGVGSGFQVNVSAPATASMGQATLSSGTVTVATTRVTSSSIIFVTYDTCTSTTGLLQAPQSEIVPGVSFEIDSTDTGDSSSLINYWIIN